MLLKWVVSFISQNLQPQLIQQNYLTSYWSIELSFLQGRHWHLDIFYLRFCQFMKVSYKFPSLSREPKDKNSILGIIVSNTPDWKIVLGRAYFLDQDQGEAFPSWLTFIKQSEVAKSLITQ